MFLFMKQNIREGEKLKIRILKRISLNFSNFQQLIKNIDHHLMSAVVVKKVYELPKE